MLGWAAGTNEKIPKAMGGIQCSEGQRLTEDMMVLDDLARQTAANDHTLTDEPVEQILHLIRGPDPGTPPRLEFLLPLNSEGEATILSPATVARVATSLSTGLLEHWLRLERRGQEDLLLVARWLCHRIGLRHRTVQLILDHPTDPDTTLVQVRGFDKVDAPGAFDMPCAGHVIGTETVEASLAKELREELGLAIADLADLQQTAHYEYRDLDQRPDFLNVEYRAVYRARLRPGALDRIRFADGEVAGLVLMPVAAVQELVVRSPERVASGLLGALRWYSQRSS